MSSQAAWPAITASDLEACAFPNWYPVFRRSTIRSRVVPLTERVVDWLQGESMYFPDWLSAVTPSSDTFASGHDPEDPGASDPELREILQEYSELKERYQVVRPSPAAQTEEREDGGAEEAGETPVEDAEAQERGREADEEDEDETLGPELEADLRALCQSLEEAIRDLGRGVQGTMVFVKTNWRAPSDAAWITVDNTLASRTPQEILLLLKSSDRIVEDFSDPLLRFREEALDYLKQQDEEGEEEDGEAEDAGRDGSRDAAGIQNTDASPAEEVPLPGRSNRSLVLRKWSELSSTSEFRCFVRGGKLVGISQRHLILCPILSDPDKSEQRELIRDRIHEFIEDCVIPKFPLQSFVCDVYMDRQEQIWVIGTNPKLFAWGENPLLPPITDQASGEDGDDSDAEVEFRVVDSHGPGRDYQPDVGNIVQRLPVDGIDVSDQSGIDRFVEFCRLLEEQQQKGRE